MLERSRVSIILLLALSVILGIPGSYSTAPHHQLHQTMVATGIADFSISATPTNSTGFTGNSEASEISVGSLNGFTGNVTLSFSSVLDCSLATKMINVPGVSVLTCYLGREPGTFAVPITGTSGQLVHNVTVSYVVLASSATSIVCIARASASSCPISPALIPGPSSKLGQQFTAAVVVNDSEPLNSFDIVLRSNLSILKPVGVVIGTVLTGTHEIVKCIGGVDVITSIPCSSFDTPDTIEYAVVGDITYTHVTGPLFTVIYNVTGDTPSSPIVFQTGCGTTSVPGGVCVSINQGTPISIPEIAQPAKFSNLPYFDIVPSAKDIQVSPGDTDATEFVTVSSVNGFGGTNGRTVNLSTYVSATGARSPLPFFSVSPSNVTVAVESDGLAALTIIVPNTTSPGNYVLNLTGSSLGLPENSLAVKLIVPEPDISVLADPDHLLINATFSGISLVTISSVGNFQGNVTLGLIIPAQIDATFPDQKSSQTLRLASKGTNTTILTVTSKVAGDYLLNITVTSASFAHALTIPIVVMDFRMVASHPLGGPMMIVNGTSDTEVILVMATDLFYNATVIIGPPSVYRAQSNGTVPSNGISVGCHPTALSIASYISAFQRILGANSTNCLVTAYAIGNYTVTVEATSGSGIHTSSHSVSFQVTVVAVAPPPPPTFYFSIDSAALVVSAGSNATSTLTLTSINRFDGTITLNIAIFGTPQTAPIAILNPASVVLNSGGMTTSTLLLETTRNTLPATYFAQVFANSGNLSKFVSITITVQPPMDAPPIAQFTFSPNNPIVGEQVVFDGSSSYDPDGSVVLWTWNPGDGSGTITYNSPYGYFGYSAPGNYTVTLTVQDNAGLTGSKSMTVSVRAQPAHDASVVSTNVRGEAVATEQVGISIQVRNDGFSNENVSITAYANGRVINTVSNVFVIGCPINPFPNYCYPYSYAEIIWNTTGYSPGNYTISATVSLASGDADPTPADNILTDGTVTIFPAPVLPVTPNNGGVGTRVTLSGSGFAPPIPDYSSSGPLWVTFDDMFIGEAFPNNGTFTFTFDVIQSQTGLHVIKAEDLSSGARASATFTVLAQPSDNLALTVKTGSVYFPGDTLVAYLSVSLNGVAGSPAGLQVSALLFFSNGTSRPMTLSTMGPGLYQGIYSIPRSGPLGTYAIVARAHLPGQVDASSMTSFQVQLSWLSSNKNNVMAAATLAGVIGLVGVAWKKGYLRRKNEPAQFFD